MRQNAFPFIFGCGRSGTTLLQVMLDSHPQLAIAFNSRFLLDFAPRQEQYEVGGTLVSERLVTDLISDEQFVKWGLPDEAVRVTFAVAPPATFADALRRLFVLYAARQGKLRYGNKTNQIAFHLPLFAQLFPEARFIHLIRDGRDVALSYRDVDWGPSSWEGATLKWKGRVEAARNAGRLLGPGRYVELKYEDLIDDPEAPLRFLCEFIGIEFNLSVLRYTARAEELLKGFPSPHQHAHIRLPPTKGLRDWRTQMPASAVEQFEAIAGDLLRELGYEI